MAFAPIYSEIYSESSEDSIKSFLEAMTENHNSNDGVEPILCLSTEEYNIATGIINERSTSQEQKNKTGPCYFSLGRLVSGLGGSGLGGSGLGGSGLGGSGAFALRLGGFLYCAPNKARYSPILCISWIIVISTVVVPVCFAIG